MTAFNRFSQYVTDAADKGMTPEEVQAEGTRILKEEILPTLVKQKANADTIRAVTNKWFSSTQGVIEGAGFRPMANESGDDMEERRDMTSRARSGGLAVAAGALNYADRAISNRLLAGARTLSSGAATLANDVLNSDDNGVAKTDTSLARFAQSEKDAAQAYRDKAQGSVTRDGSVLSDLAANANEVSGSILESTAGLVAGGGAGGAAAKLALRLGAGAKLATGAGMAAGAATEFPQNYGEARDAAIGKLNAKNRDGSFSISDEDLATNMPDFAKLYRQAVDQGMDDAAARVAARAGTVDIISQSTATKSAAVMQALSTIAPSAGGMVARRVTGQAERSAADALTQPAVTRALSPKLRLSGFGGAPAKLALKEGTEEASQQAAENYFVEDARAKASGTAFRSGELTNDLGTSFAAGALMGPAASFATNGTQVQQDRRAVTALQQRHAVASDAVAAIDGRIAEVQQRIAQGDTSLAGGLDELNAHRAEAAQVADTAKARMDELGIPLVQTPEPTPDSEFATPAQDAYHAFAEKMAAKYGTVFWVEVASDEDMAHENMLSEQYDLEINSRRDEATDPAADTNLDDSMSGSPLSGTDQQIDPASPDAQSDTDFNFDDFFADDPSQNNAEPEPPKTGLAGVAERAQARQESQVASVGAGNPTDISAFALNQAREQMAAMADGMGSQPIDTAPSEPPKLEMPQGATDHDKAIKKWDRDNRSNRAVEWIAGAAESNTAFNDVDASSIPAHGVAKASTLSKAFKDLVGMLSNGFDPARTLYYDPLTASKVGGGAGTGTAGGHAYRDGPFIITFREGLNGAQPTKDDITGVLVNPANADLVPTLQRMFPQLIVRDYNGVADVANASRMNRNASVTTDEPTNQNQQDTDVFQPDASSIEKNGSQGIRNFIRQNTPNGRMDSPTPEELIGKLVQYQGAEGFVISKPDGLYVVDTRGGSNVLIEGGLSGRTAAQLGVQEIESPSLRMKKEGRGKVTPPSLVQPVEQVKGPAVNPSVEQAAQAMQSEQQALKEQVAPSVEAANQFHEAIDLLVMEYGEDAAEYILTQIEAKLGQNVSREQIIQEIEDAINTEYKPFATEGVAPSAKEGNSPNAQGGTGAANQTGSPAPETALETEKTTPSDSAMQPDDVGRTSDGKPFANRSAAQKELKARGFDSTHEVTQLGKAKQFVIRPKMEVNQPTQPQEPAPSTNKQSDIELDQFANNTLFTADKVAAARARLKSKIGRLNSGIDPELLIDGMVIAGAYIESGTRKFSDYAQKMVADLGDNIKPYLLSFWEGARNYPDLDTTGMTDSAESKRQFDALNQTVTEEMKPVVGEKAKPVRREKKTGSPADRLLRQDWGVDYINDLTESAEHPKGVKDAFLKDAQAYLHATLVELEQLGYEPHVDKKAKPEQSISINSAGSAVSGSITMTLLHTETGANLYVSIGETALRGVVPSTKQSIAIIFRVSMVEGDRFATKDGRNQWSPIALTASEFSKMLDHHAQSAVSHNKQSEPAIGSESALVDEPTVTEPLHQDKGDQPEVATAPVVRQSLQKAAKRTGRSIKEMRDWLLGEIDRAFADAPQATADKQNAQSITFDVQGDGKFTVTNTQEALQVFRKKVVAEFKDPIRAAQRFSDGSSGGVISALREILSDVSDQFKIANAAQLSMLEGVLRFGVTSPTYGSNKKEPMAYGMTESITIGGLDLFVGIQISSRQTGKKANDGGQWMVIEPLSGLSIGMSASTKAEAIAKATAALKAVDAEKLKNKLPEMQRKAMPEAERKHLWHEAYMQDSPQAEAAPEDVPESADIKPEGNSDRAMTEGDEKITDFGEKIGGAKKDLWKGYEHSLSDDLPEDAKDVTLARHFPEPDYDALAASGVPIEVLAAIKAMREHIPSKPRVPFKLKRWAETLRSLRSFANDLMTGKISFEATRDAFKSSSQVRGVADQMELYAAVGFPAFKYLSGVRLSLHQYALFQGVKYPKGVSKWSLDIPNQQTQYFDSKAEGIVALREYAESRAAAPATAKNTTLDIYRVTKTGDIVIGKKVSAGKFIDLKAGFSDVRSAREYLAAHQDELLKELTRKKNVPPERKSTNDPRIGEDYRNGENVTPEKFATTFGFRGVEFGNYVEDARRQQDLNNAYDALIDLATILNIPPQAISLNGELGLSFGARGRGGKNAASAHYERDNVVINLTKASGAGSLAHEWWHALDNYFARGRGENHAYLSDQPSPAKANAASIRPEVLAAWKSVIDAIRSTQMPSRSKVLDGARSKDYWSTVVEMTARAFERFVIDSVAERGMSNDYLANIVAEESYPHSESYPYPVQAESVDIAKAYRNLFSALKTKLTDRGTALFSRSSSDSAPSQTIDQVRAALVTRFGEPVIAKLEAAGKLRIIQSVADIPKNALRSVMAWHGSPHRFDRFSLDHIGRGEGSQVYGWGLYFAGEREVSEHYRKGLSDQAFTFDSNKDLNRLKVWAIVDAVYPHQLDNLISGRMIANHIMDALEDSKTPVIPSHYANLPETIAAFNDLAGRMKSGQRGQLYRVEMQTSESDLLLWDAPLSPEHLVKLQPLLDRLEASGELEHYEDRLNLTVDEWIGGDWVAVIKRAAMDDVLPDTNADVEDAANDGNFEKTASLYLKSLGIAGIQYLDSDSRNKGSGSFNYVIFDDAAVNIVETFYSQNPDGIEGYYHNGQAVLIADSLSPETIIPALLHELGGHAGMQSLMRPSTYDALMDVFDRMVAAGNPLAVAAKSHADAVENDPRVQRAEYLPYLITLAAERQGKSNSAVQAVTRLIKRVTSAIRMFLFDRLGVRLNLDDGHILALAERMVRRLANDPKGLPPAGKDKGVRSNADSGMTRRKFIGMASAAAATALSGCDQAKDLLASPAVKIMNRLKGVHTLDDDMLKAIAKIVYGARVGSPSVWKGGVTAQEAMQVYASDALNQIRHDMRDFSDVAADEHIETNTLNKYNHKPIYVSGPEGVAIAEGAIKFFSNPNNVNALAEKMDLLGRLTSATTGRQVEFDITMDDSGNSVLDYQIAKALNKADGVPNTSDAIQMRAVTNVQKKIIRINPLLVMGLATGSTAQQATSASTLMHEMVHIVQISNGVKALEIDTHAPDFLRDVIKGHLDEVYGERSPLEVEAWEMSYVMSKAYLSSSNLPLQPRRITDLADFVSTVTQHTTGERAIEQFKTKAITSGYNAALYQKKRVEYSDTFTLTEQEKARLALDIERLATSLQSYPQPVQMKMPPVLLALNGARAGLVVQDLPLELDRQTLRKIIGKVDGKQDSSHQLTMEQAKQLFSELTDPAMVLESDTAGGLVIVTSLKDSTGKPFISAIHLNKRNGKYQINDIASVYSKNNFTTWIQGQAKKGNLLYFNTNKSLATTLPPFQLRGVVDNKASGQKILTPDDIVNANESDRPRFSRRRDPMNEVREAAYHTASTAKGINNWIGDKLNTMLHLALHDDQFRVTFDRLQARLNQVASDAFASIQAAPEILGRMESKADVWRMVKGLVPAVHHAQRADINAAGKAIFDGTLVDKKVYTDAELIQHFRLTPTQITLYRHARAAIDIALDQATRSAILKVMQDAGVDFEQIQAMLDTNSDLGETEKQARQYLRDMTNAHQLGSSEREESEKAREQGLKRIEDVTEKRAKLGAEGYAPLMRFGDYWLSVKEGDETVLHQRYETEHHRNRAVRELKQANILKAGQALTTGKDNPERHKLYREVSPEAMLLFAKEIGMGNDAAHQAYLKLATANHSALRRMIHRKGTAGFSEDLQRVLASFVMSSARHSSHTLFNEPIMESIRQIEDADAQKQAQQMIDYANDPKEDLQKWKSLMFIWNMGASVMFGLVNLSQPIMQTMPHLMREAGLSAAPTIMASMGRAIASFSSGKIPAKYTDDYERAQREGHLDPANVWMLQGIERGQSGLTNNYWSALSHAMGAIAQVTETVNRRATLFAALDVASHMTPERLAEYGGAYHYAIQAIQETQGVYNKGNRPKASRGNVGSFLMMYKQFSISYVEQMIRMARNPKWKGEDDKWRRGLMIMLGLLWSLAGTAGLPFADNIADVVSAFVGVANRPIQLDHEFEQLVGKDAAAFIMYGPFNFNPAVDVQGRTGMGRLIPATGLLDPTASDYDQQAAFTSMFGASGGLVQKGYDTIVSAGNGKWGNAAMQALPRSFTSAAKAIDMATTGKYQDSKGNYVTHATGFEAFVKALDGNPARIADEQRIKMQAVSAKDLQAGVQKRINDRMLDALDGRDQAAQQEIRKEVRQWNAEHPEYPIKINRSSIRRKMRAKKSDWRDRTHMPKGMEKYWLDQ